MAKVLLLVAALLQPLQVFAVVKKFESHEEMAKFLFENAKTFDHAMNVMKNAGVSKESLKVIEKDLRKRLPASFKAPKMTLVKNQVFLDGKATRLKITSYSPFTMQIDKRTWTYNEEKLGEENYQSAIEFLSAKIEKSAGLVDLLLPKANAQFFGPFTSSPLMGTMSFGLFGLIAAMAMGMSTNGMALMGMGGALMGNMFSGGMSAQPTGSPGAF